MYKLTYIWPELRHLAVKFEGGTTTVFRDSLKNIMQIADEQGLPYTEIRYYDQDDNEVSYSLSNKDRIHLVINEVMEILDKYDVDIGFDSLDGYSYFTCDGKPSQYQFEEMGLMYDCFRKKGYTRCTKAT